jgi:hypothetical protein
VDSACTFARACRLRSAAEPRRNWKGKSAKIICGGLNVGQAARPRYGALAVASLGSPGAATELQAFAVNETGCVMKTKVNPVNILKLLFGTFAITTFMLVFALILFLIVLLLPGPIDEEVGIVNRRALKNVQSHIAKSGNTINDLVHQDYAHVRWSVHHADDRLMHSYVRCEAVEQNGRRVTMKWYVRMRLAWENGPLLRTDLIGAINEDAARIAPKTVIPGRPIYKSPDMAW